QGHRYAVLRDQEAPRGVLDTTGRGRHRNRFVLPPCGTPGTVTDEVIGDGADSVRVADLADDRHQGVEQVPAEVDEGSAAGQSPAGEPAARVRDAARPDP